VAKRGSEAHLNLLSTATPDTELEELRERLREAQEALESIRLGEVDAVVVGGPSGERIYTITNADRPYRLLVEQMKEGAVTLSAGGLILYCNEAFAALVGNRAGQISGTSIQQYVLTTDVGPVESLLSSVSGGRIVITLITAEHTQVPVNLSVALLADEVGGKIVCGIITDLRQSRQTTQDLADASVRLADQIAVRQQAEALLHQAQKMEVVGQLTGGLAHDFNNLLMIIGGNLDLIRRRVTDNQVTSRLDQVLLAVQRGAKLTQQLLAFSRIQSLSPESVCINDLLPNIELLVRRAVAAEIEVRFELAPAPWCCRVDPNQLESAILNMAINARHAMPKGGSLTIATENITLEEEAAATMGEITPGRYVLFTMTDTGTGMSPAVLARVFEPFFTTKGVGQGSGLGLSQVYGFARQSGGHIAIESHVGRGTSVRLYLPWTEPSQRARPVQEQRGDEQAPAVQRAGVLIVEDDAELRELVAQLVRGLGYQSCSASTAAEAMDTLARNPDVGLVFTDVLMPGGMNGFELAAEIRRRRPDIAVLITSGFPGNFLPDAQLGAKFEIIRKPFTEAELAAAISRAWLPVPRHQVA
jgi:PAS domain S-box-containing protein